MTHEHLSESAAAYAIGALDPSERTTFETHLAGCDACRAEVASLREVVGHLPLALPVTRAPNHARLRNRILREARERDASRRGVLALADHRPVTAPVVAEPVSPAAHAAGHLPRRSSTRWMPWAAAASIALLAGAGGYAMRASADAETTRGLQAQVAELRGVAARAERSEQVVEELLGPEVHVVSLSPTAAARPTLRVYWNHTKRRFVVTAFALPPTPAGKSYQLWAIVKGKAPMSMGTFVADANGRATTTLPVSDVVNAAGTIALCALTLEPLGGSPQPTETPRLVGEWRHTD